MKASEAKELRATRWRRVQAFAHRVSVEKDIPVCCILGRSRQKDIVAARHELWLRLNDGGLAMAVIADLVGVDHTSIVYALKKLRARKVAR